MFSDPADLSCSLAHPARSLRSSNSCSSSPHLRSRSSTRPTSSSTARCSASPSGPLFSSATAGAMGSRACFLSPAWGSSRSYAPALLFLSSRSARNADRSSACVRPGPLLGAGDRHLARRQVLQLWLGRRVCSFPPDVLSLPMVDRVLPNARLAARGSLSSSRSARPSPSSHSSCLSLSRVTWHHRPSTPALRADRPGLRAGSGRSCKSATGYSRSRGAYLKTRLPTSGCAPPPPPFHPLARLYFLA